LGHTGPPAWQLDELRDKSGSEGDLAVIEILRAGGLRPVELLDLHPANVPDIWVCAITLFG